MKKLLSLVTLSLLGSSAMFAQNTIPCYTDEMLAKRIAENPAIEQIHNESMERLSRESESMTTTERGGVSIIPVVFHVIHANGAENIPKSQIDEQIEILNKDFSLQNADAANIETFFLSRAANSELEFRLATKDENGNCTDGVVRVYSELTHGADDNVKELSGWDNEKYLNVWVVASIELEDDDPNFVVAGYAYYPNVVNWGPEIDGIVIRADQVGENDGSRTLTHEVGHYLGLPHTFNNGCSGNGDGISDTPPTAEANYGCDLGRNSCHNDSPDEKDNIQNHMDYSNCRYMFTNGQKNRMHSSINQYRSQLVSGSNNIATGVIGTPPICVPKAEFSSNTASVCAGGTVTFTDESWNAEPTSWNWSFPGGNPASSNSASPTVTYDTPGTYSVTLTSGTVTGSDTKTKTSYIHVSGDAEFTNAPYSEGFEDQGAFNNYWTVNNPTGSQTWSFYSSTSYSGNSCVRMNNFSAATGSVDELISPSYDLSNVMDAKLYFKMAYVQKTEENSDKLRVLFSTNCGQTWVLRWVKVGSTLKTGNPQTSVFVPSSSSQWEEITVNLSQSIATSDNVRVKFEFTADGGNQLYIDDINLGGIVGVNEITAEEIGLMVYPNPTNGTSTLSFDLAERENLALYATDIVGKRIEIASTQSFAPGQHQIEIGKEQLGASGIYMLTLEGENMRVVEKLVVY